MIQRSPTYFKFPAFDFSLENTYSECLHTDDIA